MPRPFLLRMESAAIWTCSARSEYLFCLSGRTSTRGLHPSERCSALIDLELRAVEGWGMETPPIYVGTRREIRGSDVEHLGFMYLSGVEASTPSDTESYRSQPVWPPFPQTCCKYYCVLSPISCPTLEVLKFVVRNHYIPHSSARTNVEKGESMWLGTHF